MISSSLKMQKLKKSYCSVKYCRKNSVTHPEMSYFRLPRYPERAAIWLKKIHRENTTIKKILVCEAHFEQRYISVNESRKRLISAAIPTLNLPYTVRYRYDPDSELAGACTIGTQTDHSPAEFDEDSIVAFTHTIKMEREDELECKSEMDIDETEIFSHLECSSGEVAAAADDSSMSISNTIQLYNTIEEKAQNEVHSDDFKFFALQLYFTSPRTYKVLQQTLKLPLISNLYRLCIPTSTEISEHTVRALKIRVNDMTDDQKQCAVCIGTMALKPNLAYDKKTDRVIGFHEVDGIQTFEPAKFLFILMVRGVFHDWKQVISYSLLASNQNYRDVKTQLDKAFQTLFDIGLNVRVFISDMESEFMSATLERKITPELPYFFINSHKIYYMYDPPHILRAVWDVLPKNDYQVGDDALIKWKYISDFYDIDMARAVRFAPKLTVDHMKLKVFKNDNVSMAAQVFSNTTAAGIAACIDMKLIDESAKHTVECILKLNKLFDMLNFSSFGGKNQKVFSGEQSQVDFLRETMFWLDQIRLVGLTGKDVNYAKARFIRGYKITINTILSLYEHFSIENRNFVKPRFTRDCIDTFIEKVRAKYCENPTSQVVTRAIRTFPIFSVFKWRANKTSSNELETFLELANAVTSIQVYTPKVESTLKRFVDLSMADDFATDIPETSRLQYIVAYVLHVAAQRYKNCDVLNAYVLEHNKVSYGDGDKEKEWDAVFVSPPPEFVHFIRALDRRIKTHLQIQTVSNPILHNLIKSVERVEFATRCECFPLDFVKELYIAIRFNTLLNYNNKELTNCKKCRKTFTVYDYC